MTGDIPKEIWAVLREFSGLATGHDAEVQEACRRYLDAALRRHAAALKAAPSYDGPEWPAPRTFEELPPDASEQECVKHMGDRDS